MFDSQYLFDGGWLGESGVTGYGVGQLQKLPGEFEVVTDRARRLWGLEMGSKGG